MLPEGANIVRFEYLQRTNSERGPALVGLEVARREDLAAIHANFAHFRVDAEELGADSMLLRDLV